MSSDHTFDVVPSETPNLLNNNVEVRGKRGYLQTPVTPGGFFRSCLVGREAAGRPQSSSSRDFWDGAKVLTLMFVINLF